MGGETSLKSKIEVGFLSPFVEAHHLLTAHPYRDVFVCLREGCRMKVGRFDALIAKAGEVVECAGVSPPWWFE